ncbi:MAG: Druantia anti-phage system protein DruA, partial [Spirochaetota bacterium]
VAVCHTPKLVSKLIITRTKYLVLDNKTGEYLGIIKVNSLLYYLNRFFPISRRNLFKNGQHILNCAVIVPTQPFGYNLLGGKLLALLSISDQVQNDWYNKYNITPVLFTTTSLFGAYSQYTGLNPYWKLINEVKSNINYYLPEREYNILKEYCCFRYPRDTYKILKDTSRRNVKNKFLQYAYNRLKIPEYKQKLTHKRGQYTSPVYENYLQFLNSRINLNQLTPRIDTSVDYLVDYWKKLAKKRYNKLKNENRLKTDNDLLIWMKDKNWEDICI